VSPHLPLPGPDDLPGAGVEPGVDPGRPAVASSATVEPAAAPRHVWDRLSDDERRRRLDAMDPDHVRSLATTMPLIEQAKGILMGCYGCDPTAAFAVLNRVSSSRNLKLRDLATMVVAAASTPVGATRTGAPTPCEQVQQVLQDPPPTVDVSAPGRVGTGQDNDGFGREGRA
jgi:hypothetical protein